MATPEPQAKIGIISLGDMGSGLARLLVAKGYAVATNCQGRSQDTIDRALEAGAELLPSDVALVQQCDLILSVVPPRDAAATAQRIVDAIPAAARTAPLYFADMNAVSPATVRAIAGLFQPLGDDAVRFIDGSILGGPPVPILPSSTTQKSTNPTTNPPADEEEEDNKTWTRPLLPTSGPHPLATSLPPHYHPSRLALILRIKHISPSIGAASGLKMCFASLSKGFAAISVQAVTTAQRLGVLPDLRDALRDIMPANLDRMDRAVVGMGPKAYRWVREMEEISATHAEDGGFREEAAGLFKGAAGVFRTVAEDTVLGEEKVGKRKRRTTAEDVARAMVEGMEGKRKKRE